MSQMGNYQAINAASGTVTSISAGTSITLTPNPITTTGTVALTTTNLTTTDGTVYWDGSLLNTTTTGTSGQVLTSNGPAMPPTYQNAASSGIVTLDGDTGSATGSTVTISGGVTGLTTSASGSLMDLGGILIVAHGGTGTTTLTGVLTGNGTSAITGNAISEFFVLVGGAANVVSDVGPGTAGQVFLSGGAAANPGYVTPTAGSGLGVVTNATTLEYTLGSAVATSIVTDSGTATPSSNSFTISGSSTGLTTTGSGSTVGLTGTLAIAHGGTNTASYTQSNGIVTYNGTSLVNYAGPQISSSGINTNTSQPIFLASQTTDQTNVTGDGTLYTITFTNVLVNQGSYFDGTSTFTAPVAGLYCFFVNLYIQNLVVSTVDVLILNTTTQTIKFFQGQLQPISFTGSGFIVYTSSLMAQMNATDTATISIDCTGASKTVTIAGSTSAAFQTPLFGGYLLS